MISDQPISYLKTQNSKLKTLPKETPVAVTLTELAELRLRTFVRGTPNYTPSRGIRIAVKDGG